MSTTNANLNYLPSDYEAKLKNLTPFPTKDANSEGFKFTDKDVTSNAQYSFYNLIDIKSNKSIGTFLVNVEILDRYASDQRKVKAIANATDKTAMFKYDYTLLVGKLSKGNYA